MASAGTRILAADDDEEWRRLLGLWLGAAGYEVTVCASAPEVVPAALRLRPRNAILDYDLGGPLCPDLIRGLRACPELDGLRSIVLTAMPGKMLDIFAACPPDHFVVKSAGPEELLLVISSLLGG